MTKKDFKRGVTIRTTPKAKRAIDRVVAALKASEKVAWRGDPVTKEAVINASWLWLEEMPEDVVEDAMAKYVPRFQAVMDAETAAAEMSAGEPPADEPNGMGSVAHGHDPKTGQRIDRRNRRKAQ